MRTDCVIFTQIFGGRSSPLQSINPHSINLEAKIMISGFIVILIVDNHKQLT